MREQEQSSPAAELLRLEGLLRGASAPSTSSSPMSPHLHRGHGGWQEGRLTHLYVEMTALRFAGLARTARQRLVHQALAGELEGAGSEQGGLHALRLSLAAPDEKNRKASPAGRADAERAERTAKAARGAASSKRQGRRGS